LYSRAQLPHPPFSTLSLHDALPISIKVQRYRIEKVFRMDFKAAKMVFWLFSTFTSFGKKADLNALYHELITDMDKELDYEQELADRKSTRLNSSHVSISYAVFCWKQ